MAYRILVTGRGSAARRHVQQLRLLVPDAAVAVVAAAGQVDATLQPCEVVPDLAQGLAWKPDAVVIASVSSRHAGELLACLRQDIPCLAEKPIAIAAGELAALRQAVIGSKAPVQVGCNLRHLPALVRLKKLLHGGRLGRVIRAQLEVGQDLVQWRPSRDVAGTYSAKAEQGGGVVFDLVHEIDMARWLLGPLQVTAAVGGHLSALPIDCDDVHIALLRTGSGAPVTVALDYVSQQAVRRYAFVAERGTIVCDLMARRLSVADRDGLRIETDAQADFDVGATYAAQMADWLASMRDRGHVLVAPLADALESAELMLAMKAAA
jgi:predicted dehydrogenase